MDEPDQDGAASSDDASNPKLKPKWLWGDEDPDGPDAAPPTMLDDETAELVAEAELLLATGRTLKDIEELFKRAAEQSKGDDSTE
jgi:hypothetical protein